MMEYSCKLFGNKPLKNAAMHHFLLLCFASPNNINLLTKLVIEAVTQT